jgi:hypothetical protein
MTKYVEEHNFNFDLAYDETASNEQIYIDAVRPMIEAAFNKTKITCFAYGQTGSGKTFTMMGPSQNALDMGTPGLYLLSGYDIFNYLEYECYNHLEIWVSFYEIYCGKLYDLFDSRKLLQAREDGKQNICIVGLTEKQVTSLNAMMNLIEFGLKERTTGVTGANSDSSRSHAIIQISIKEPNGDPHGKISFIDLAGSERAADTIDTNKQTRIDGAEINKSLLALKECIRALDQDKKHTPFRGSKLTLVLRDSFMGNCKTLMIANISPCLSCSEHTLNTLRYADRVKELRGKDNKEKNDSNQEPAYKDPQEILANILMMPRQHSKTVKYNVDKNLNPLRNSSGGSNNLNNQQYKTSQSSGNNNMLNKKNSTGSLNMNFPMTNLSNGNSSSNNLINNQISNNNFGNQIKDNSLNNPNNNNLNQNIKNKENNLQSQLFNLLNKDKKVQQANNNNMNYNVNNNQMLLQNKKPQQENKMTLNYANLQNNSDLNSNSNNLNNVTNFLNNYTNFSKKDLNVSQPSQKSQIDTNEEEIHKLTERHKNLIEKILVEEESYIENHGMHLDEMVELFKEVLYLIYF